MEINYKTIRKLLINFIIVVISVCIGLELMVNVFHASFSDDLIHVSLVGLSAMVVFILSCDKED